jgi:hypothetical protein
VKVKSTTWNQLLSVMSVVRARAWANIENDLYTSIETQIEDVVWREAHGLGIVIEDHVCNALEG